MADRLDMVHTRELLLAEEAHLTAALATVRSKLNALLPVASLPSEILEEIFSVCVSWLYGPYKPKHRLAWTQVCSSWRCISLSSSRLWQRIDLCDARFADEFLVRSKQAPLSIVSATPLNLKITTENLVLHLPRLRCIDVFLFSDDMIRLFSSIGAALPAAVTHLSLKVPPRSAPLALNLDVRGVRHLALDCVAVNWYSCQNLLHLSVRGLNPACSPSIAELHDMFEASPNIEFVRLENLVPPNLHSAPHRKIPLNRLKDMSISAYPNIVSAIVSALDLSPSTRLQLFTSLADGLHTLFPLGLPYANDSARDDTRTVRLSRHSTHFRRHGAAPWGEESAKTLFSLSAAPPLGARVSNSLGYLLNMSRVTALELNAGALFDISPNALVNLLSGLYALETLRVAFNELEGLLGALQRAPVNVHGTHSHMPRVFLPRLRTLAFSKPSDLWYHFADRWIEPVMQCAQVRQEKGAMMETVEFYRCSGIEEEAIRRLSEFVGNVCVYPEGRQRGAF